MSPLISQSERLDRLLGLLSSREGSTAATLAKELGVSVRTIRRDLAQLTRRGVPIEAERGRGGGVRAPMRAGLGRLQLDHREVIDLLLALAIGERLGSPLLLSSLKGLRQKIAIAFPPEERFRIARLRRRILHARPATHRVAASWLTPKANVLGPIQEAFFEQRAIEVTYGTIKEKTTRVIEPHYLLLSWPVWYLLVFDHLRGAIRTLRLDRIEAVKPTDQTFGLRPVEEMLIVARDLFVAV